FGDTNTLQIEVKKAQPRGNIRDRDQDSSTHRQQNNYMQQQQQQQQQQGGMGGPNQFGMNQPMYNGMTPAMMAQNWMKMQQYWAAMQRSGGNPMAMMQAMGGNPMMMQGFQGMGGPM